MNLIEKGFDKYRNLSVQAKASIWYSGCSILQKGISFIVIPIYTRMLTTSEYGQYIVFQSWRDLLIIFATLNLYCGIFTKAMVDHVEDRDRYTSSMQGLGTVFTTFFLVLFISLPDFWSRLLNMEKKTLILLILYYYVFPAFSFWSVRQRVEYKYRKMVVVTLFVSVITPAFSIYLLKNTDLRAQAVIWGFLVVQIVVGLLFYIYNFYRGRTFFVKEYWIHAICFNFPLIPHYLSLIVLGQADRIMIDKFCGSEKAGIYGLAYSVSQLMIIFIAAINGSMVPWIYEKLKKKDYNPIATVSNSLCVLCGFMSFGAILISPEIIMILGTNEYTEAKWIVPVVSLSVYFTFCYGLFSNVEFYYNSTKYVMFASTIGAGFNLILNYIFIPLFGYIAAAYTTLVCYFLFMLMHYIFMKKVCDQTIGGVSVFDNKFIFLSSLFLFVLMFVCMVLYNFFVLRYIVIGLIAILSVLYRKKIRSIIICLKDN